MKLSNETRKKISESTKGRIPWNKGKKGVQKWTQEQKDKMKGRIAWNKGRKGLQTWSTHQRLIMSQRPKGEKHPSFTGTNMEFYKREVKKRDNYTCQICLLKDEEIIEVDHILPVSLYPELRLDVKNMRCLCPNCHTRKSIREKRKVSSIKNKNGLA